ncbi:MAG TPA: BMC domain-containing protein [Ignavibacteriaceae bacterium]|nr:BMC domain-containing protein [Ignavibacteriaceae bacterium]
MPKALGLVETRGLVAAIEAADAMLKTSNVVLIGKEIIKPALVTIKIAGDVAAVKASVDAGAAAAKKVGIVVSTHVIPQPDSQMELIIPGIKDGEVKREDHPEAPRRQSVEKLKKEQIKPVEISPEPEIEEPKLERIPKAEIKKSFESENLFTGTTDHLERLRMEALGKKPEKIKQTEAQAPIELEKMNVHELRKHARETEGFPIQGREISKANRKKLLDYFRKIS